MKTFDGWREVGRAMRWARQQGAARSVITDSGHVTEMAWLPAGRLIAFHDTGGGELGLFVNLASGGHLEADSLTAAEVLRVLAALDLIPAELAEGFTNYEDPLPSMTDEATPSMRICRVDDVEEHWGCTRAHGHPGRHEAGNGEGRMYASWPQGWGR